MKLEKIAKIKEFEVNEDIFKGNFFKITFSGILSKEEIINTSDNFISKRVKKEPILKEKEKKYLGGVIRPFKDEIEYIRKRFNNEFTEWIEIYINGEVAMFFPYFKKNTMYKGMELNKKYTLEELEI